MPYLNVSRFKIDAVDIFLIDPPNEASLKFPDLYLELLDGFKTYLLETSYQVQFCVLLKKELG